MNYTYTSPCSCRPYSRLILSVNSVQTMGPALQLHTNLVVQNFCSTLCIRLCVQLLLQTPNTCLCVTYLCCADTGVPSINSSIYQSVIQSVNQSFNETINQSNNSCRSSMSLLLKCRLAAAARRPEISCIHSSNFEVVGAQLLCD